MLAGENIGTIEMEYNIPGTIELEHTETQAIPYPQSKRAAA